MAEIKTRLGKGAPLTYEELDTNFEIITDIQKRGYAVYDPEVEYRRGARVSYNDLVYVCLQDNTNRIPSSNPNYWEELPVLGDVTQQLLEDSIAEHTDREDNPHNVTPEQIIPGGNIHDVLVKRSSSTGDVQWVANKTPQWRNNIQYISGDIVKYQGVSYRAIATNTNQTPSDGSNYWVRLLTTIDREEIEDYVSDEIGNLGTASTRDVGVSSNNLVETSQLNTRIGTTSNLGTAAQRNIGTGNSDVPDTSQLNTRLGTSGNLGNAARRNVGTGSSSLISGSDWAKIPAWIRNGGYDFDNAITLFYGNAYSVWTLELPQEYLGPGIYLIRFGYGGSTTNVGTIVPRAHLDDIGDTIFTTPLIYEYGADRMNIEIVRFSGGMFRAYRYQQTSGGNGFFAGSQGRIHWIIKLGDS